MKIICSFWYQILKLEFLNLQTENYYLQLRKTSVSFLAIYKYITQGSKTKKRKKRVLWGDQCLWWMDGRWWYYSKYWTNTWQEHEFQTTHVCMFLHLHACRHVHPVMVGCCLHYPLWGLLYWLWLGAVTHLFFTSRMATSTSSIKTRTPALIPAIFTTRSVCLAGSGMTSGSSVAPTNNAN